MGSEAVGGWWVGGQVGGQVGDRCVDGECMGGQACTASITQAAKPSGITAHCGRASHRGPAAHELPICRSGVTTSADWRWAPAGHSLGGALAILAAYEVRQRWPESDMRCYTFGGFAGFASLASAPPPGVHFGRACSAESS